jgi:hypothetical protein
MSPWFPALAALLILTHGCATEPGPAELMRVGAQAAANREAQTRRFQDVSEAELLAACVGVLQDQGFRITASEARLGVISGTKPRSVEEVLTETGRQMPLAIVTLGLHPDFAMGGPATSFNVVLATRGVGGKAQTYEVRATFYRAWSNRHYATVITSPALYQKFFGMLDATLARTRSGK